MVVVVHGVDDLVHDLVFASEWHRERDGLLLLIPLTGFQIRYEKKTRDDYRGCTKAKVKDSRSRSIHRNVSMAGRLDARKQETRSEGYRVVNSVIRRTDWEWSPSL